MKLFKKILIIIVCVIFVGFLAYKIAYPFVAPLVFDYIVEHHMDAFVKLEKSLEESLEESTPPADEPLQEEGEQPPEEPTTSVEEHGSHQPEHSPATGKKPPASTPKPDTEIQAVKTTMGVFSGEHLARALKNMSPQDKTRIISLCQSAVSTADILKVSSMMMKDGLTKEQQKYIENYLRDNLSVEYKREILEILKTY